MDNSDRGGYDPEPAKFRDRLKMLAEMLIPREFQARFDSSDIVQESLMRAHQQLGQFRGGSDGEFLAWLQQILRRMCIDKGREHGADMRNAAAEISLQHSIDQSFANLEKLLVADSSSPSSTAKNSELIVKALDALATLPDEERKVMVEYYLQQRTQQQTADTLNLSKAKVARCIAKSLMILREKLAQNVSD